MNIRRKKNKKIKDTKYYLKILMTIVVITPIVWFLLIAYNQQWLEINKVNWHIHGKYPQELQAQLQQDIQPLLNDNYLNINLKNINKVISGNAWVDVVYIKRSFWLNIDIKIRIKEIMLRLNDNSYIDTKGNVFTPKIQMQVDKPLLITKETNIIGIYREYLRLQKILGEKLPIKVIKQNKTTQLIIANDITLQLGYQRKVQRIRSFISAYNRLLHRYKTLKHHTIDMRYVDGLVVKAN